MARLFLQQKPREVAGMTLVETGQETALAPQVEEEQDLIDIGGDCLLFRYILTEFKSISIQSLVRLGISLFGINDVFIFIGTTITRLNVAVVHYVG